MSSERKQTELNRGTPCCPDTGMLQDQELDGASGGFVIYGAPQALGGPDTIVWSTEMPRQRA
jgi:hypothetical protein